MNSEEIIYIRKKCFRAYTLLVSAIINYTTSKSLFEKRSNSWGITSAYYTQVQIARMIIYILEDKYPYSHNKLFGILKSLRNSNSSLREVFGQKYPEIEIDLVCELGDQIEILSKIRNSNSYDSFIIANQINHDLLENEFLKLVDKLNSITRNWIAFSINLFRDFILLTPEKQEFIGLLYNLTTEIRYQWGFPTVINELRVQAVSESTVRDIEWIIKSEFENKIPPEVILKPPSNEFFESLTYTKYKEKGDNMEQFRRLIDKYLLLIDIGNY